MSFVAFLFVVAVMFGGGAYNECALTVDDGVQFEFEELKNETRKWPDNNCEE